MIAPPGTPVRNRNTGRAGVVTQRPDARVDLAETVVTCDGHDTVVELDADLEVAGPGCAGPNCGRGRCRIPAV